MKYILTWNERSQGSAIEYENAQKRILEVFTQWKAPDNFKIEMFVVRVGDWGGYMLLDCDDPLDRSVGVFNTVRSERACGESGGFSPMLSGTSLTCPARILQAASRGEPSFNPTIRYGVPNITAKARSSATVSS